MRFCDVIIIPFFTIYPSFFIIRYQLSTK